MDEIKITIVTPTYNRAYILPQLYKSLISQTDHNFIWFVVVDGSTDGTKELFEIWISERIAFKIVYRKIENGGKPRAINWAIPQLVTPFIFIVDSDDYLTNDAIAFLNRKIIEFQNNPNLIGIGVLRGDMQLIPKKEPIFKSGEYVDATNLERAKYGLDFDANELYKCSILEEFPFETWPGEKFVPEAVSLNKIALQGYALRWYNKVLVISDYLNDGMTKGAWGLIKNNPMGYAIAYNESLLYPNKTFRDKIRAVIQFLALIILAKNPAYILKSHNLILSLFLLPIGLLLSIRRYYQLQKLCI